MDIMEEVKFPTKDSEWIQKVLIGGILGIIPIINFIEYGYILKLMKGALEDNSNMPKWEDWGNLFINGFIAFIISLIYMIIPILVLLVSVGGVITAALTGNINLMIGAVVGAIGGVLISLLLALIFGFLIPMALAMYTKENSFGAAFRIGEILSRIKSTFADYITVYIVLIVVFFILGLLNSIPILGILIMIFGSFYILAVAFNMFGKIYARSST